MSRYVGVTATAIRRVLGGTSFVPTASGILVLGSSGVAVPLTGSTNETQLALVNVAAGALGINGSLRITTLWSVNNDADAKTGRIRLGGIAGTQIMALNMASTATYQLMHIVRNRGAANSQVFQVVTAASNFTSSSGVVGTASVDTAVSQDLVISGQLASAADTITLEAYTVELVPGV